MHQAICLLEASYTSKCPERPHSRIAIAASQSLSLPHRELIRLCKSPDKTSALVLANVVTQLVIEKKSPTLLVTGRHSLAVLAVNLLLWRAGISLVEAIDSVWSEDEFLRLTVAASELASAPLLAVRTMPIFALQNLVHASIADHGTRWVIMDNAQSESFGQLSQLSCKLDVPITIISP